MTFRVRFRHSAVLLDHEGAFTSGLARQAGAKVMAKHTRITIETDSLLVLRGRRLLRAWCPVCSAEVEMIPLDGVGVVSNLTPPEVLAWMESEELHRTLAADGAALICLNSMLKRMHRAKSASRAIEQVVKRRGL